MQNAGLEEAQAGIKISGRNINNLRYTDDTTFMAEGEEELKSLLMKVKEESEKGGLQRHTRWRNNKNKRREIKISGELIDQPDCNKKLHCNSEK